MVSLNVKQSLSMSSSIRNPITHAARDKSRVLQAPSIPSQALTVNNVSQGFNIPSLAFATTSETTSYVNPHVSPPIIPLSNSPLRFETTLTDPEPSSSTRTLSTLVSPPTNPQTAYEVAAMLSRKRVAEELLNLRPQKKERKRRTCRKCAHLECSGSQRVANCKNPCQDCGQIECEGRNPKLRGNIPCDKAWGKKPQQ